MLYNPSKTLQRNLIDLINAKATYPFMEDALVISDLTAITPAAGNGNTNTQIKATATVNASQSGNVLLTYNRLQLAQVKPGLGNKIYIDNSYTTHQQVQDYIVQKFGFDVDFFTFTNPSRLPLGGESQNYTLTPVGSNNYLYLSGIFTIAAINNAAMQNADPDVVFGTPTSTTGGVSTYTLLLANTLWATSYESQKKNFVNYLNRVRNFTDLIKVDQFTVSNVADTTVGGSAAYSAGYYYATCDITPVNNSYTKPFKLIWVRRSLDKVPFTGVPSTILNLAYNKRCTEFLKWYGLPIDGIKFLPEDTANPTRINYAVLDSQSLVYKPNAGSYFTLAA